MSFLLSRGVLQQQINLLSDPMVLVFDTNLSSGTTVTVPLAGTVDCVIDWGDGNSDSYTTTGNKEHTYSTDGEYTVKISGLLTGFGGNVSRPNLTKCLSFGDIGLVSLGEAFRGCENLIEVPTLLPSTITSMSFMFFNATNFNQDISSWNVQNITNMNSMFNGATVFNQNISSWNVSSVTNMAGVFSGATSFNQNISSWNVSSVTNMASMFRDTIFNQDISSWNVSSVTNMSTMFLRATGFNQNLSDWITGVASQPTAFSLDANATFANNANNLKPFLSDGTTRINT